MSYECIDDYGRILRTRKEFNCEWCGECIDKGDVAVIRVYKWEGEFNNHRQHPECYSAMRESLDEDEMPEDGFHQGDYGRGITIYESENGVEI